MEISKCLPAYRSRRRAARVDFIFGYLGETAHRQSRDPRKKGFHRETPASANRLGSSKRSRRANDRHGVVRASHILDRNRRARICARRMANSLRRIETLDA